MAKQEHSAFQKKIISRYYENLDTIALTKLQELVTELYLADTEAKKDKLWQRVQKAMVSIKVNPAIIKHLMEKKDIRILAQNLNEWLKKA
jgi:hypothetical protein